MPTTTTTYSFNKPVVGADEDSWGGYLNGNWDSVDDLLDGTTPVTGIDINSGTLDGVTIGGTTAGAGTFTTLTANTSITGTLATAAQPNVTSLGTLTSLTVSGDVSFGDNDKAIFGAGSDLQIYHDGLNSYVRDVGTGVFLIQGDSDIWLQNSAGTASYARFTNGGAATLYHNNSAKLTTTNTGVDITGTLTSDGLTVDGRAVINGAGFSTSLYALTVDTTFDRNGLEVLAGNSGIGKDIITAKNHDGTKEFFNVADSGDISFYEDTGTTAKFFWDASAESLGIGTSSPDRALHVESSVSGASTSVAALVNPNSGVVGTGARLWLSGSNATTRGAYIDAIVQNSGNAHDLVFATNGDASSPAERMRIDSSGNLLVGTTDSNVSDNSGASNGGINIGTAGVKGVISAAAAQAVTYINRLGSDGDIAVFRKDGTTVGSIGSSSIGGLEITGNNSSRSLLLTTNFFPANGSGAKNDGVIDLGVSDARWKDLYLSGGVYLGGTGSANKLDDYEEGTWTPTLTGSASAGTTTYTTQAGYYTKIGRLVNINCIVNWSAMTGSGFMELKGIPFPIANLSPGSQNYPVGAALPSNINWTGGTMFVGLGLGGSSIIALYGSSDDGGATRQNCVNESANFRLTMSYMTT